MSFIIGGSVYYSLLLYCVLTVAFTWLVTQSFKVILKCWILGAKFNIRMFVADGDFPSSHTAVVTSCAVLVFFLNMCTSAIDDIHILTAYNSAKDFVIVFTLASIVIRDAMGQRHRQDNTNKNLKLLKDYVKDGNEGLVVEKIEKAFTSIDNEALKRVGHLKHEVIGGFFMGITAPLYPLIFFFNMFDLIPIALIMTAIYIVVILAILKFKPSVIGKIVKPK